MGMLVRERKKANGLKKEVPAGLGVPETPRFCHSGSVEQLTKRASESVRVPPHCHLKKEYLISFFKF